MKHFAYIFTILSVFLGITSCSNGGDDTPTPTPTPVIVHFTASLTPVAGTGSLASGDAKLEFNQTAKTFEITVTFTGLTATTGHIHGADGAPVFPFSSFTSPIKQTYAISDAQIVELMANHYYVNLHSAAFPNGEISGFLMKGETSGGGGGGGGGSY
ncbi:CHRD domain-containing protein [Flavobacterium taihuense]|uniref:CHRD domain-containing protein n=1 Tax=Flavobacterium taihuense TaxID=2857508 RepID=A0ABS6Y031_9FLAO|nr:CHRD domain-containing protein [Flavobacterium taihuense]MBW4361428.1 CHRD domain-containing protein [Flavobacterium taihuense]